MSNKNPIQYCQVGDFYIPNRIFRRSKRYPWQMRCAAQRLSDKKQKGVIYNTTYSRVTVLALCWSWKAGTGYVCYSCWADEKGRGCDRAT